LVSTANTWPRALLILGNIMSKEDKLKTAIDKTFEENKELLERLGSDYDKTGTPYWDKEKQDEFWSTQQSFEE
jgi:regulator of RNase E activity RraB